MPVCALARNSGPLRLLERLPGAIAFCRFFSVLTKCAHEKANPMGAPDHAVSKCPDRRIFRAGSALAPTASLLRPGRFLRGAVRRAANLINDCQWQSHLNSSALPTAPPLSRILSPFLGGTRKGPPEGYPAESPDMTSDRTNQDLQAIYHHLQKIYVCKRCVKGCAT